jgi:MerR family regulatory protein
MALTIGKVAKAANVHVETLRYYERRAWSRNHQGASPCIGAILKALCAGFGSSGTRR